MLPALHDTGTGEAVLFLHAFTMDASQWDHQVAALSGDMRCVRVDLWGCGASPPPPPGDPSLDTFAAAVLEALDRGEPVTVLHRGRAKARLVPVQSAEEARKPSYDPAFGLWKGRNDLADVAGHVRRLRSSRLDDL